MVSDSNPITSYPWYVPDWQSSETRLKLSLAERGLFRELLDHCHTEGSIPDNVVLLARMCGASLKETKRLFPQIRDQFVKEGDRLINPKATEVRRKLQKYRENRSKNGTVGAKKRWAESPQNPPSFPAEPSELPPSGLRRKPDASPAVDVSVVESPNVDSSAMAEPWLSYSLPLPLPLQDINTCSTDVERASHFDLPGKPKGASNGSTGPKREAGWGTKERSRVFRESFWPAWPRKVAKAEAEKAWLKHASSPETAAMIVKAATDQIAMLTVDGLKFCPHAASWLNAKRYEDDPGEAAALPAAALPGGPTEWKPPWEETHG